MTQYNYQIVALWQIFQSYSCLYATDKLPVLYRNAISQSEIHLIGKNVQSHFFKIALYQFGALFLSLEKKKARRCWDNDKIVYKIGVIKWWKKNIVLLSCFVSCLVAGYTYDVDISNCEIAVPTDGTRGRGFWRGLHRGIASAETDASYCATRWTFRFACTQYQQ